MGYTIRVSLPGKDAGTSTNIDDFSIYADSDNILIKEERRGTMSVTDGNSGTVGHALGYIPFYLTYGEVSAGRYSIISGYDPIGAGWKSYTGTSNLIVENDSGDGTVVQYYVFYDNLP